MEGPEKGNYCKREDVIEQIFKDKYFNLENNFLMGSIYLKSIEWHKYKDKASISNPSWVLEITPLKPRVGRQI